ncbi:MAG: hypothetical protein LAT55_05470 [Opitutales bacterium]|nr:hypothetical protein [Opitutales bacterium]
MKKILTLLLVPFLLSVPVSGSEKGFEAALFHPVQIHDENTSITGVRLNVFYAINQDVKGVDLGFIGLGRTRGDQVGISWNFIGSIVEGDMVGWQTGLYTDVYGDFTGLKGGFINIQRGDMVGWQSGVVNFAHSEFKGLQTGFYNSAADMRGLQFGVVNYAENLHGLQIGLANINASGDPLYFFPFVNFSF